MAHDNGKPGNNGHEVAAKTVRLIAYLRAMHDRNAIAEMGATAYAICAFVAERQDLIWFREPFRATNKYIQLKLRIKTEAKLVSHRNRAVELGWLTYKSGKSKQTQGEYSIAIPSGANSEPPPPKTDGSEDLSPPLKIEDHYPRKSGVVEAPPPPKTIGQPPPKTIGQIILESSMSRQDLRASGACTEVASQTSVPNSADIMLTFSCVGNPKEWHLLKAKLAEYAESFPGLDVLAECRKARQWTLDNRNRRKTARGMPSFLCRWLTKANDEGSRGGGRSYGTSSRVGPGQVYDPTYKGGGEW